MTEQPVIIEIDSKELELWATKLQALQSALWDVGYKHMSAEMSVIVHQMKEKFIP